MGVPGSDMHAAEQPAADSLLNAFKTIDASGKSKHASVLDYWLSIRGDREFPPLHDLDPLKLSDAGPSSALLELIGGGEDAEVRHLGETLKTDVAVERIIDAPRPSILSCIAKKLSIVAISRNFLAFEDQFLTADSVTRCWVTLLPLSSAGAWVDYVYAFVTFETVAAEAIVDGQPETPPENAEAPEFVPNDVEETMAIPTIDTPEAEVAIDPVEQESEDAIDPVDQDVEAAQGTDEPAPAEPAPAEPETAAAAKPGPGFSEVLQTSTNADGFYGAQIVKRVPARSPAPPAPAPAAPASSATVKLAEPTGASEGPLPAKLAAVRAKADEARMAKLQSNAALYQGLGAAYDFALDAEDSPEEYLKLVEAQGLKIQLRSPMKPVMKLAFDGMCDDATIARLEAVLAWALEQELPRGSLAAQIEAAGGIARILNGEAPAS
jgi:hypothetical protein